MKDILQLIALCVFGALALGYFAMGAAWPFWIWFV